MPRGARMLEWTAEDVAEWMRDIGYSHHAAKFVEQDISGEVLKALTSDELKDDLGVTKLGERKTILERIGRAFASNDTGNVVAPSTDPVQRAADFGAQERAAEASSAAPPHGSPLTKTAPCGSRRLSSAERAGESAPSPVHQTPLANRGCGEPAQTPRLNRQSLYLLDGRNIACEGRGSNTPSALQLRLAQDWFVEHRPTWTVRTFLYQGLVEEWRAQADSSAIFMSASATERIVTPRREDVDKFIIRRAIDAEKEGDCVRIVSNDAFSNYIGTIADAPEFNQAWVKEHLVKFCFDGDAFIPSDGFFPPSRGTGPAAPGLQHCPDSSVTGGRVCDAARVEGEGSDAGPSCAAAGGAAAESARSCMVQLSGKGARSPRSFEIVEPFVNVQCPHRRFCHLRLVCKAANGAWRVQLTGIEAPASRAERLEIRLQHSRSARTWCPTCRRPLEFRWPVTPGASKVSAAQAPLRREGMPPPASRGLTRGDGFAFVTVLFGPNVDVVQRCVLDALVLGHSLRCVGTRHDMLLLHTADVLSVPGAPLLDLYWQLREVDYVEAAERLTKGSESRFRHVFTKLRALGCTEYNKVVLLDSDLLVCHNVDELTGFPAPAALRRGHRQRSGGPVPGHAYYDHHGDQRGGVNLGVAVLPPSEDELSKMLQVLASARDPMHQASRGPDQDFLTRWPAYVDKWGKAELDLKYNFQLHQLRHALEHEGPNAPRLQLGLEEVKVIHYSGELKPRDFYFQHVPPETEPSFARFCDELLLQKYCGSIEGVAADAIKQLVRAAASKWRKACLEMWKDVLARVCAGDTCPLCGHTLGSGPCHDGRIAHCFLECKVVREWEEFHACGCDAEELRAPAPGRFANMLSFVAAVHERRCWLGTSAEAPTGSCEDGGAGARSVPSHGAPHAIGASAANPQGPAAVDGSEVVAMGELASPARDADATPACPAAAPPQAGQGSSLEDESRWVCSTCDEPNRDSRTRCNNCGGARPVGTLQSCSPITSLLVKRAMPLEVAPGSSTCKRSCFASPRAMDWVSRPSAHFSAAATGRSEQQPTRGEQRPAEPPRPRRVTGSVLDGMREQILAAVSQNRVTIIVAPTGCGKSTGIPQMILDEVGIEAGRRILCTQPRRIAATSLAKRVAEHRGTGLGAEVGYQIGGCNEISRSGRTRLIYAVTAIAMIQCLQDCATFTHLLVDEVHIRDSFIDFLLTLVVTKVLARNREVKVVLMSAAMDSNSIASYFAQALGGEVPRPLDLESCRPFPITTNYLDDFAYFNGLTRQGASGEWHDRGFPADWNQEEVAEMLAGFIVELHQSRKKRVDKTRREAFESFLVFLAGKREVTLIGEKLDEYKLPNLTVKLIFGGQTIETQERVLKSGNAEVTRTVILATDVVESSVTIPDVDVVIDSCEHKRLRWDPSKRQSLLTLLLISQDEAKQRGGRTGRVRPGHVIRLISKVCFESLRPHVEPQIRHSRLDEVLLTIFELPNLGDPREFLLKMPDPPDKLRVDTAITRLLELNALDKSAAVEGGPQARPTHFGRFLQKMPLDPEVGCLVMNGVRLRLVQECAVLAAVHQRGEPFLDSQDWKLEEVRRLRDVRDACSPGRAFGRNGVLPGDLMAGLGAYKAWQKWAEEGRQGEARSFAEEATWCAQHYLSLDRLQEIEEMVMQIRDVLEELGYGEAVPSEEREQLRRRRQERLRARDSVVAFQQTAAPNPADDLRRLLPARAGAADRDTELLLAWCIASSFTAGIIEIKNGSSTEQVKYRAKRDRSQEIEPALIGYRIVHSQRARQDPVISFQSPEEAHRALQEAALINNRFVPWRAADMWGRPVQRTLEMPRKCYEGAPLRIMSSSLAHPTPTDDATVVAGEVLACMDHKRTSMSYFCTKCSVVPRGILPLVLYTMYPARSVTRSDDGAIWKITSQIHGAVENISFKAPSQNVERLMDGVRAKMDTEFGTAADQRNKIVDDRRRAVLELMCLLDQPGAPPMPATVNQERYTAPRGGRVRNPQDDFAPALFSFLRRLEGDDLSAFRL